MHSFAGIHPEEQLRGGHLGRIRILRLRSHRFGSLSVSNASAFACDICRPTTLQVNVDGEGWAAMEDCVAAMQNKLLGSRMELIGSHSWVLRERAI